MRVLICGGRDLVMNAKTFNEHLRRIIIEHGGYNTDCIVIHGGAAGADTLAQDWADRNHLPVEMYVPQWKKYGRAAGPRRNARMLAEGKPDLVVAFPGGPGTADMVHRAEDAGVRVERIGWS